MSLYHYTNFKSFTDILENGTLRFKESTASNDKMDTVLLLDYLKWSLQLKMKDYPQEKLSTLLDIIDDYKKENGRISLIVSFTSKPDSRFYWDAYTINRTGGESSRYNGVCIDVNEDMLLRHMAAVFRDDFDVFRMIHPIEYGYEKCEQIIEKSLEYFYDYCGTIKPVAGRIVDYDTRSSRKLLDKYGQSVVLIPAMNMLDYFFKYAPLYKNIFWKEEDETRALISIEARSRNKISYNMEGKYYYYDIPINETCINKIILGPEFNKDDEVVIKGLDAKIDFGRVRKKASLGTGVIRSR